MKKGRFIVDFIWRSFMTNIGRWVSSIVILFCGIIIVNMSFAAWYISQQEIDNNFTNNEDLKILNVSYDAQSARMTYNSINAYEATDEYYQPVANVSNLDEPIDFLSEDGQLLPLKYIVLNDELLKYVQLNSRFSKDQWNTENMIIFNPKSIGLFKDNDDAGAALATTQTLTVDDFQIIKLPFNQMRGQEKLVNPDQSNPLLLNNYDMTKQEIFLPKKWEGYSIIPEATWFKIIAQKAGKSVDYVKQTVSYPSGMRVVVRDFSKIDAVAHQFERQQFRVEYGLSDFENMTQTVEYFKLGAITFGILIIIMIVITNMNLIKQFIAEQRHEIGLMKSLGYSNQIILSIHLGAFILQALIILFLITVLNLFSLQFTIGLANNIFLSTSLLCLNSFLLLALPTIIIYFIIAQEVKKEEALLLKGV